MFRTKSEYELKNSVKSKHSLKYQLKLRNGELPAESYEIL